MNIQRSPSDSNIQEFKDLTKRRAVESLQRELDRLVMTGRAEEDREISKREFDGFLKVFRQYISMESETISWAKIQPLPPGTLRSYSEIDGPTPDQTTCRNLLSKLVVVKLNGGLGTSMGCKGPKSVIPVRSDLTFLDLTIQQVENINKAYGVDIPLVLMNSFNTDDDTKEILAKYSHINVTVLTFLQSRHPRLNKESLLPVARSLYDQNECWYPPGHGDIYEAFSNSGLLKKMLDQGKEYVFVTNVDNLGATVDINILKFLMDLPVDKRPEFVMEVTDKTRADIKGGTLINYEGRLRLLEIAQVPKDYEDEFKSVKKFKIFNTNNLWIQLKAMQRVVELESLDMEIIINPKTVGDGKTTTNVIQLERAAGAAIKCFERSVGVIVPRRRFLPVKTTADLLLVMSNLYAMRSGMLELSPKRSFETTPLVKLGSQFSTVKEFLSRFANIPDMLELDHLTVSGDVTFGKNVSLRGTVIIIANHGDRIDIPPGAILENKIVSGNLRILVH